MATQIPQPGTATTQPASTQPFDTSGGAPPPYSADQKQTYLGVPNDYTTAQTPTGMWGVPATFTSGDVPPQYKQGDQYRELPTDTTQLALLQHALIDAGYISDTEAKLIAFGSPDPRTAAAFEKLLVTANISGGDWQDALSKRLASVAANPQPTKQLPPLTVQLTNPEDIKDAFQKTAQTLYGGDLPDDQVNAFVSQFQAKEQAAQTQAYNQQYNVAAGTYGPGGTTVAPPNAGVDAAEYIKNAHPNEVAAEEFGNKMSVLLNAFTKPVA